VVVDNASSDFSDSDSGDDRCLGVSLASEGTVGGASILDAFTPSTGGRSGRVTAVRGSWSCIVGSCATGSEPTPRILIWAKRLLPVIALAQWEPSCRMRLSRLVAGSGSMGASGRPRALLGCEQPDQDARVPEVVDVLPRPSSAMPAAALHSAISVGRRGLSTGAKHREQRAQ
jgi:hypothetical protein